MQTRTKLAALELIGGVFGWLWILAALVAVYFLVAALAFDGGWSSFFWALGISAIGKWLLRGFMDSQKRVGYEAEMVASGATKEQAAKAWAQAYSGGRDILPVVGDHLRRHPRPTEPDTDDEPPTP